MKYNFASCFALGACVLAAAQLSAAEVEEGFTSLMDGKTFNGWKKAEENPNTWKIVDGAFVANGERCHLFFVGDEKPFKNFHLKVEVKTKPKSNGGIYFHTKYQPEGWPRGGFECQVNNTHSDWIKTGSLYGLVNIANPPSQDQKWWTQEIIVKNRTVMVLIDGSVSSNTRSLSVHRQDGISSGNSTKARLPCKAMTRAARSTTATSASNGSTEPPSARSSAQPGPGPLRSWAVLLPL